MLSTAFNYHRIPKNVSKRPFILTNKIVHILAIPKMHLMMQYNAYLSL